MCVYVYVCVCVCVCVCLCVTYVSRNNGKILLPVTVFGSSVLGPPGAVPLGRPSGTKPRGVALIDLNRPFDKPTPPPHRVAK